MEVKDFERQKLVIDYLVKMYIEQNSNGLHREGQRTTATTIYTAAAAALLAFISARWGQDSQPSEAILPLSAALAAIGLAGSTAVMKIYERAQVNFIIADSYRHTADLLLADDVGSLVGNRVKQIKYVARTLAYVKSDPPRKPFTVWFPGRWKRRKYLLAHEYEELIDRHNPIDPREVIIPKHNALAAWFRVPWVLIDTHKVWTMIHFFFFIMGIGLSAWALA